MEPQRIPPGARAHVRSRYLKGVVPLTGGEVGAAAEVTGSKNERSVVAASGRGIRFARIMLSPGRFAFGTPFALR